MGIEGPGRHLVQQGLPDVGAAAVHQGDLGIGTFFPADLLAELGGQLDAAGPTADDDDAVGL